MRVPSLAFATLIALACVLLSLPASCPLSATPPHEGARSTRPLTVCIDPGHPSETSRGAKGRHITEIRAAWQVALKLKEVLEQRGLHVVMTKTSEDELVTNRRRAEIANEALADLMLRLHCDSAPGSGIATFAPDRQGVIDGIRGPSASVIRESQRMGRVFHHAVVAALAGRLRDRGFRPDSETLVGARQGELTGSIYSKAPVLLVEMCVLSNARDEAFIRSDRGQQEMAEALADGAWAALGHRGS